MNTPARAAKSSGAGRFQEKKPIAANKSRLPARSCSPHRSRTTGRSSERAGTVPGHAA